jgi:hypothetical protein
MKPISVEEAMAQSLAKITSVTPEVMQFVNERIVHSFPNPCSLTPAELRQGVHLGSDYVASSTLADIAHVYAAHGWEVTRFGLTHLARIEIARKESK